eukprot:551251-Pyramimonas_sp.AAC.1
MKMMIGWVTGVLQDMSRRQTAPIIFTDLNGGLCKADDLVAGPYASGRESLASSFCSTSSCRMELKCGEHLLLQPAVVCGSELRIVH